MNVQRFSEIEATIPYIDEKHGGEQVVHDDKELEILNEPEQISKEAVAIEDLSQSVEESAIEEDAESTFVLTMGS